MGDKPRCKGITKDGTRCKFGAQETGFCKKHEGQSDEDPLDLLDPKEKAFAYEYVRNGFRAGPAAHTIWPEITKGSSYKKGSELSRKPEVRAEIDRLLEPCAMSAEETLARLSAMGRANVDLFLDEDDRIDLSTPQARANLHLIKEIDYDKIGRASIKLHDSKDALKSLAKIQGLVSDRVEHTGSIEHRHARAYDYSVLSDDELSQLERIVEKLESTVSGDGDPSKKSSEH